MRRGDPREPASLSYSALPAGAHGCVQIVDDRLGEVTLLTAPLWVPVIVSCRAC